MLEARSIAVVGASDRPGSFGLRLATEALRSPSAPVVHLIHPTRQTVMDRTCVTSLAEVPGPVDLVLLGIPDEALVGQVSSARERGDGGVVVYGTAAGLGEPLRAAAGDLALCGAGCMGFVNVARGVRAIGYLERDPLPSGGIALISHSGSVFSALLRTHRRLEYSLVVSSGQELVTTAADYLAYALGLPETKVVGLFLETLRDAPRLREGLAAAAERDIPVVALTVGGTQAGRALVAAHSGAVAGDDAGWEALFAAYGVHRAYGLDDLVDSLEAFSIGRRVRDGSPVGGGLASAHDSGAERVLVADVADRVGVPFAELGPGTSERLRGLLGPGLAPANPLDVWSTGAETEVLFTACLLALADDEAVDVVALAVDLVPEYDGDDAYPRAVESAWGLTDKPVVVLTNLAAAVDQTAATRLRSLGVPVLEGTWSGLRAVGHLLTRRPGRPPDTSVDDARRQRWADRLAQGRLDHATSLALLADYGVTTAPASPADSAEAAALAAEAVGYPVVMKIDDPAVAHKSDVAGVVLGLRDADAVAAAYRQISSRLGPVVSVQSQVPAGVEVYVGLVRDPHLGCLVVVAPGGVNVETLGQRRVGLPPLDRSGVSRLLDQPTLVRLLAAQPLPPGSAGAHGMGAVGAAVQAVSQVAVELGDLLGALDVNPLIVSPSGTLAVAVDALVIPRPSPSSG